ncbi:MAG: hypothetical protein Q4B23_02060 [Helcococcus sp.]|nr:hypothetical protein [Helcococcus sp.]
MIKKHLNKIIIFFIFAMVIIFISFFFNNKNANTLSDTEAREKISELFGEEIEKVKGKSLVLTDNKDYTILVVRDQYILIDKTNRNPILHHYISIKDDIEVKVLEIFEDGYLVEHDDHTHIVKMDVDKNVKVGDIIKIKDPHTYLD